MWFVSTFGAICQYLAVFSIRYSVFETLLCSGCTEHQHTFATFDRAYREEDGGYKIIGRADDVIAIGEHRYDPYDLEKTLVCLGMHSKLVDVYKTIQAIGPLFHTQVF